MIIIKKDKNKKIITDIKVFKIISLLVVGIILSILFFITNNFQINLNFFLDEQFLIMFALIFFSIVYYFYMKEKIIIDIDKNTLDFKNKSIRIENIKNIYYEREITPPYKRNKYNTNIYYYTIFLINNNNEEEILIENIVHEKNILKVLNELEKIGISVDKEMKIIDEEEEKRNDFNFKNTDLMGNGFETWDKNEIENSQEERVGIDDEDLSDKEIENKVDEILDEEDRELDNR